MQSFLQLSIKRGFGWDALPLTDLITTASLITLVLEGFIYPFKKYHTLRKIKILAAIGLRFTLIITILLAMSRLHLSQWKRIDPQFYGWRSAPNPGTPAVLYKR